MINEEASNGQARLDYRGPARGIGTIRLLHGEQELFRDRLDPDSSAARERFIRTALERAPDLERALLDAELGRICCERDQAAAGEEPEGQTEEPPPAADLVPEGVPLPFTLEWDRVSLETARVTVGLKVEGTTEPVLLDRLDPASSKDRSRFVQAVAAACPGLAGATDELDQALVKVAVERAQAREARASTRTTGQGRQIVLPEPEPWGAAVDGGAILSAVVGAFRKHIAAAPEAHVALGLWVAHSYLFELGEHTPRLCVTSPERRCGKTVTLSVIENMAFRPLPAANLSAAVLYRAVEKCRPTLLIDEADTFLRDSDELRGVLNAGHRRGGTVLRCTGDDFEPAAFEVFSPVVIALIGAMPATLMDRSVIISLKRRLPGERIEPLNRMAREDLGKLASMLRRWADDHRDGIRHRLEDGSVEAPAELDDRCRDNWLPLFAIADEAGPAWSEQARSAAVELSKVRAEADSQTGTARLLADLKVVLASLEGDPIPTRALVDALLELEEAGWSEANKGRPITAAWLSRRLRSVGAVSRSVRTGTGGTVKGFPRDSFKEPFSRYLPAEGESPSSPSDKNGTTAQPKRDKACAVFKNGTEGMLVPFSTTAQPKRDKACAVVPFLQGGEAEKSLPGDSANPGGDLEGQNARIPSAEEEAFIAAWRSDLGSGPQSLDQLARWLGVKPALLQVGDLRRAVGNPADRAALGALLARLEADGLLELEGGCWRPAQAEEAAPW